jgi:multidrug efflux pump subunit AcrA (membrane-fusion protein)
MSKLNAEKARYCQFLTDRHNQQKDSIRRRHQQSKMSCERIQTSIETRYDSLQARLDNFLTSFETKTAELKGSNLRLKATVEIARRNLSKARSAAELRDAGQSSEIQAELRLQMKVNELRTTLDQTKTKITEANAHNQKYKDLYLKNVAKQKKIQESRGVDDRLKQLELDRRDGLAVLRQRIKEEQELLERDLERLRKMREDLLHPPPPVSPKKTPREAYRELLREAGQIPEDSDDVDLIPIVGGHYSSDDALVFPNTEANEPEEPVRQFVRDEVDTGQLAYLENNVRTLLGTGNYTESDPLIVRLRSQIAGLVSQL